MHLYSEFDAVGLGHLVRIRDVSPLELVDAAIGRVEAGARLNAVIWRRFEQAREEAKRVPLTGPFAGVPYLQKDLGVAWEGAPNTRGCRYFSGLKHSGDSLIATRLRAAGFILLGLSNSAENGWSLSTEPSLYGPTLNPWRDGLVAGGSSGGSGAAVAAGMVPIAGATDAAGSIRIPAANNGLVGLKPSRGRVTFAPQQTDHYCGGTQVLCVSRSVRDTAGYLDVVKGNVAGDPYWPPLGQTAYAEQVLVPPKSLRIGMLEASPEGSRLDRDVSEQLGKAAAACAAAGHRVEPFSLELDYEDCWRTYADIVAVQTAMAFSTAATQVGHEVTLDEVSPTTWANIQRGRAIPGFVHAKNIDKFRAHGRDITLQTSRFDVTMMPTMPAITRPMGYWDMNEPDLTRYNTRMGQDCAFTVLFNISGQPAISLPLGASYDGLPIGIQFAGRYGDELTLLRLSSQLEKSQPWHLRRPPYP